MSRKKTLPDLSALSKDIFKMLIPPYISEDFEVYSTEQRNDCWIMELREKEDRLPTTLSTCSDTVLDVFCNPIEVQSNAFASLKPVYLRCYRRRWKHANEDTHWSNF